jgi:hypothetical protein
MEEYPIDCNTEEQTPKIGNYQHTRLGKIIGEGTRVENLLPGEKAEEAYCVASNDCRGVKMPFAMNEQAVMDEDPGEECSGFSD